MALYDRLGVGYAAARRPDPRIAAQLRAALGSEGPVLNVGAGTGSYEPVDLPVVAVEPSRTMLRQRREGAAPAVQGVAEALPFPSGSFAAGLAVFTVHHWADVERGLAELRRVVRGPVVMLTWDAEVADRFWLVDEYVPAAASLDHHMPRPATMADLLGGGRVEVLEIPGDCSDGFFAAYWRRPEAYLDPRVRAAISGLARLPDADVAPGIERLRADLERGVWHRRHAGLLDREVLDVGYRIVVADPA